MRAKSLRQWIILWITTTCHTVIAFRRCHVRTHCQGWCSHRLNPVGVWCFWWDEVSQLLCLFSYYWPFLTSMACLTALPLEFCRLRTIKCHVLGDRVQKTLSVTLKQATFSHQRFLLTLNWIANVCMWNDLKGYKRKKSRSWRIFRWSLTLQKQLRARVLFLKSHQKPIFPDFAMALPASLILFHVPKLVVYFSSVKKWCLFVWIQNMCR